MGNGAESIKYDDNSNSRVCGIIDGDEVLKHWYLENPTDDDVNTMRILFNAQIGDLCNQCRHNDAEEMEGIRDRLIKRLLETPKIGRWVATENEEMEIVGFFCSECDLPLETEEKTAYCPHCGSKMEQNEKN